VQEVSRNIGLTGRLMRFAQKRAEEEHETAGAAAILVSCVLRRRSASGPRVKQEQHRSLCDERNFLLNLDYATKRF
jgi:hypothetical protein